MYFLQRSGTLHESAPIIKFSISGRSPMYIQWTRKLVHSANPSPQPKGHHNCSHSWVTDWQTDHATASVTITHLHTHNRFTALFPGPPGWAGGRRELLDFMVQGKINRGRHTDHPAGRHSSRTNQCPPPPSPPIFFAGQMPFLPPNQQRQSTEGN